MAGAKASANLYSLIETAKACGIEPYAYLRHVFTELPKANTLEDIEALVPGHIDPAAITAGLTRCAHATARPSPRDLSVHPVHASRMIATTRFMGRLRLLRQCLRRIILPHAQD